jgi:uncharacterized membrane protein
MASQEPRFLGIPFVVIVALGSLVLSLLLIIALHSQESTQAATITNGQVILPTKSIWIVIGEHIATALFILGIWHAIDYIFIRREFNKEIKTYFNEFKIELTNLVSEMNTSIINICTGIRADINKNTQEIKANLIIAKRDYAFGLVATYSDVNNFDISTLIKNSTSFTAVMSDGHSWTTRHAEALRQRFRNKKHNTTFIFAHPESDQIPIISRKIGINPESYPQRIYSTIKQLKSLNHQNVELEILGHFLISPYSLFIADEVIVISPYYISSQRGTPPVIVIKNVGEESYFQKIVADIEFLKNESAKITTPPENSTLASDKRDNG